MFLSSIGFYMPNSITAWLHALIIFLRTGAFNIFGFLGQWIAYKNPEIINLRIWSIVFIILNIVALTSQIASIIHEMILRYNFAGA
ncbi:hypothetical protein C4J81_06005 [Deltaproteobacteria bacterium Smac51]|nr:hypothetical protein C4J81_06005 [Deltaproteobacteria bacterium Smac51]